MALDKPVSRKIVRIIQVVLIRILSLLELIEIFYIYYLYSTITTSVTRKKQTLEFFALSPINKKMAFKAIFSTIL